MNTIESQPAMDPGAGHPEERLSIDDLIRYLSRLADLNKEDRTGNPEWSDGLRQVARALRPHAALSIIEFADLVKGISARPVTSPRKERVALPPNPGFSLPAGHREGSRRRQTHQIPDHRGWNKALRHPEVEARTVLPAGCGGVRTRRSRSREVARSDLRGGEARRRKQAVLTSLGRKCSGLRLAVYAARCGRGRERAFTASRGGGDGRPPGRAPGPAGRGVRDVAHGGTGMSGPGARTVARRLRKRAGLRRSGRGRGAEGLRSGHTFDLHTTWTR